MLKAKGDLVLNMVACAICCCAIAGTVRADEVMVGAGATATENIFKKIQGPFEQATGDKLNLISDGPVKAFKHLEQDIIEAAAVGMTFVDFILLVEKEGCPVPNKNLYRARVIGRDVIRVLTNKDVTVSKLSEKQLTGIFTGEIKNWSEVGGPRLPIKVVLGSKILGTQAQFQKKIMGGAEYTKEFVGGTDAPDVKRRVIATSGAISIGPLAQVDDTVNAPTIPKVSRPVVMVTKRDLSPGLQRMVDFIKGPGQALIVQ